jgi:cytochrome c553
VNVKSGDTTEIVKNGPIAIGHLTPLHEAASVTNYEAVKALIKAGADLNANDVRNATPLVFAVATDRPNVKIVELLLSKGSPREPALEWVRRYQNPAILPLFGLKPSQIAGASPIAEPRRNAREATTKALASSQPMAAKFLPAGGCVSCHAQHINGMAVAAAKAVGLKTDNALEAGDIRATASLRGAMQEQLFQVQDPPPGVDGMQFSLLQLAAAGVPATLATDSLVHHVAAMQRKEGIGPTTVWPGRRWKTADSTRP